MLRSQLGTVLALALGLSIEAWAAGVAPARLEVNLGPIPIDLYNLDGSKSLLQACRDAAGNPATNWTARDCILSILGDEPGGYFNPNNCRRQGVTGVRFMFGLGGGFHSTPFDAQGNVREEWRVKLRLFFGDLKLNGITRVTPTPMLTINWTVAKTGTYPNEIYDANTVVVPCRGLGYGPGERGCNDFNHDPVIGVSEQPLRFYK